MLVLLSPVDVEVCHCYTLSKKSIGPSYVIYRGGGSGEIYSYMPESEKNTKVLLTVPPKSYGNPQFGFSVGRGAFVFQRGRWVTVAERVKLNNPGEENGNTNEPFIPVTRSLPEIQANLNSGSMGKPSFL